MISIYTTHPTRSAAEEVTDTLLQEWLIACALFSEVESRCRWKGELVSVNEATTLFKTIDENWEKVRDRIIELHPDETPCIIRYQVSASIGYEQWVEESIIH